MPCDGSFRLEPRFISLARRCAFLPSRSPGFADEAAVAEFADSSNVGEPLKIPPVSLSPEESATVVSMVARAGGGGEVAGERGGMRVREHGSGLRSSRLRGFAWL